MAEKVAVLLRLVAVWDFTWRDGRSTRGKPEVSENFHHNFLFDDNRDGSHFTAAEITVTHVEGEVAREWDDKQTLGGTQPNTHQKKYNGSRTCHKR